MFFKPATLVIFGNQNEPVMALAQDEATQTDTLIVERWTTTRRISFRFFFIYFSLLMADLWLYIIPYSDTVTHYYSDGMDWLVQAANKHFFHIRDVLVYPAGSGDTSYGWANQWLNVCLALAGCLIWSAADRKRTGYNKLSYWFCLSLRYFLASSALSYGIIKMFWLQMPFPNQSQLATPLGDLLPMRLCWMFIGYSGTYQFFSGLMETLVGLLLLYRRTATLGTLLATAVFTNVAMLNLSYDIPVKIYSMNLAFASLFLLSNEYKRLVCFFVLNKPAAVCNVYHVTFSKKWMRVTRVIIKIAFVVSIAVVPMYSSLQRYQSLVNQPDTKPIQSGMYDVAVFTVNKDTLPPMINDSMRWQDVIFEKNGIGSIKTADTTFRQRYRRGYFSFETDSVKSLINFKKWQNDSAVYDGIVLSMRYQLPDSNTVQLWGKKKNDSLYVLLKRSNRHFQLADKPFHWLSEYNR